MRNFTRADNLDHPFAIGAQTINPHAVLGFHDDGLDPINHFIKKLLVEQAFEHAVLHPSPVILECLGQPGAPPVVRNVIGNQIEHGLNLHGKGDIITIVLNGPGQFLSLKPKTLPQGCFRSGLGMIKLTIEKFFVFREIALHGVTGEIDAVAFRVRMKIL